LAEIEGFMFDITKYEENIKANSFPENQIWYVYNDNTISTENLSNYKGIIITINPHNNKIIYVKTEI